MAGRGHPRPARPPRAGALGRRMAAVRQRAVGAAMSWPVLNEEWAHHGFCVRDLDKLSGQDDAQRTAE